jgi:hypothetical protein
MMDRIGKIIGMLMMSRTMAHKAHLKTGSYAKHRALNGFYDDVVDLLDELAEAAQGKYGCIDVVDVDEKGDIEDPIMMLETHLKMYQNMAKSIDDRFLQNISDEIEALYYSTLYKLKCLN